MAAGISLLGLDLLIDALRGRKPAKVLGHLVGSYTQNHCTYDGERFDCATCFGEGSRLIQLPRLSGGKGEVTFGKLTVDLTGCTEIIDGCTIELECTFGSLDILIPGKYRVEAATHTAFSAAETRGAPHADAETTVYINCRVSFGQITIRHI